MSSFSSVVLLVLSFAAVAHSGLLWPTCICTMEYNPVCASNGITYSNPCHMTCADPSLTIAHPNKCMKKSAAATKSSHCERPCPLYLIEGKFCATDGRQTHDFGNECVLQVELCKAAEENRYLSQVACPVTTTAPPPPTTRDTQCATICPLYYIQGVYCAVDHQGNVHDYGNECFLNSAKCIADKQGLSLTSVACK